MLGGGALKMSKRNRVKARKRDRANGIWPWRAERITETDIGSFAGQGRFAIMSKSIQQNCRGSDVKFTQCLPTPH